MAAKVSDVVNGRKSKHQLMTFDENEKLKFFIRCVQAQASMWYPFKEKGSFVNRPLTLPTRLEIALPRTVHFCHHIRSFLILDGFYMMNFFNV